jgi:hypothetical protein
VRHEIATSRCALLAMTITPFLGVLGVLGGKKRLALCV